MRGAGPLKAECNGTFVYYDTHHSNLTSLRADLEMISGVSLPLQKLVFVSHAARAGPSISGVVVISRLSALWDL